jgi:diphosphomevalonate decarboxylase
MDAVRGWRDEGIDVFYTVDAGANVHCVCPLRQADEVELRLASRPEVAEVLRAEVGDGAHLI